MMKAKKAETGKPQPSDELPVGRVAGLFGIRGELKCDPTRAGRMLFSAGETLRATLLDGTTRSVSLEGVREHKGRLLVRFAQIASPQEAEELAGATLYAPRDRIELAANEFLDSDLTGCALHDASGVLGTVERIEHYPASDMLVVGGKLVPLIEPFVKSVDIANKRIDVDLPEGLLED
jgi:16S rRNA processing protein RimM